MLKDVRVQDQMSRAVVTTTPNTPILQARTTMKEWGIRHLPVIDNGKLVGILSVGDIREASPSDTTTLSVWELNYLWEQITVKQVMTHPVVTVAQHQPVIEAVKIMIARKFSSLPVVDDDGHLVGILTETDIFQMLVEIAEQVAS
jgi:acetoin utilization protein AcuB